MTTNTTRILLASVVAACTLSGTTAHAQSLTSAFTYQGELIDNNAPASGSFDLRFRAFDAVTGGTQVGPTLCVDDLLVENGRLSSVLNFGEIFAGQRLFLEVQVRSGSLGTCADLSGYTILTPRQELGAAPYATYAVSAAQASTLGGQPRSFFQNASNLTVGTIPDARLGANIARTNDANVFTGTVQAPTFVGALSGNAATATTAANLNGQPASFYQSAANLNAGVLADARLSTNVPRLNASNTFTGTSTTFTNIVSLRGGLNATNPSNVLAAAQLLWQADVPTLRVSGSGTGAANGLAFATPTSANAMRISDAGDIGIGTSTPEAPLHVRGGGSLGGIVVTPDVADASSQILLSENTSASNAMLMRYNGTTNNLELRGRNGDVDTAAHITINRDTGALVIDPAVATGDASVQLPASSVGAGELADEPGLDFGSDASGVSMPNGSAITLASVTVTAPGPGFVVVTSTPRFSYFSVVPGRTWVNLRLTTSSAGSALLAQAVVVEGSFTGFSPEQSGVAHEVFTVGAGATTFYLRAQANASGVTCELANITAMYFPTRY